MNDNKGFLTNTHQSWHFLIISTLSATSSEYRCNTVKKRKNKKNWRKSTEETPIVKYINQYKRYGWNKTGAGLASHLRRLPIS